MSRGEPKGQTTGDGMWLAGTIGLACGTGNVVLAAMATGLAIAILWLLLQLPTEREDSGDG